MVESLEEPAYRRVFAEPPVGTATAVVDGPRGDLADPAEVATMVRRFYADVDKDDLLGPMFNDVAQVDWSEHLPKLTAFWSRALFGVQGYAGNPFRAHSLVHQRRRFTDAHFHRWLTLFHRTVDAGWAGPNAEAVKDMALRVAAVHSRNLDNRLPEPPPAPAQNTRVPQDAAGQHGHVHPISLTPRTPREVHD